MTYRK